MMTSLGVYSCRWRELRPINFGGTAAAGSSAGNGGEGSAGQDGGDEEAGFGRGRGRGRGRDGGGEYEMVAMKVDGAAS